MFGEAELLVSMGYGWDVISKLPIDAIVGYHLDIHGNPTILVPSARSVSELTAKMEPAVRAGLKGRTVAAPLAFITLSPDFVKTSFTVAERTLTPTEMIDFIRTGLLPGPEPQPMDIPPPEEPEPAYFTIDSDPAGGQIWIDDVYTGFLSWKPNIEVTPGTHKVEIKAFGNYVDTQVHRTAIAGQTINISIPMAPIPGITPPPEPEPTETPEQTLARIITEAGLDPTGTVSDFLIAYGQVLDFLTNTFGTELPAWTMDPVTGKFTQLDTGKKVLFFVSMAAPITVGETALQGAIGSMTAAEIRSLGTNKPKELLALVQNLTKEQSATLFARLQPVSGGEAAIQTIQRVIFDARLVIPTWAKLSAVVGAGVGLYQISHTLNFLGFLGEEAIQTAGIGVFTLVSNKEWEGAALALPIYRNTVDAVVAQVDGLMAVPILNFWLAQWWPQEKAAVYAQIDDYDTVIKAGLKAEQIGSIAITTVPTGATVWLNDVQQTFPSNTVLDKLVPGMYAVRIELSGYVEHQEGVTVEVGVQAKLIHDFVAITERPAAGFGRIEWEAKDSATGTTVGVSWYINGRLEKSFTTAWPLDLSPGTYEMRWTAIGYKDYLDTIVIDADKTLILPVEMNKLEPLPEPEPAVTCETLGYHTEKPIDGKEYEQIPVRGLVCWQLKEVTNGFLEISSTPEAEIWILGEKIAEKTPARLELVQGMYDVTLKAAGHIDETIRVWIMPGQTVIRAVTLTPEEIPVELKDVWRIDTNSLPSGAKILVNYAWTGKYTPDFVLLDPGQYLITLTKSGFKPWETPLTLEAI